MDIDLLKIVGQIAGIGGLALGVFLLLFRDLLRKRIFPRLTKKQGFRLLSLIAVLVRWQAVWSRISPAGHMAAPTSFSSSSKYPLPPLPGSWRLL